MKIVFWLPAGFLPGIGGVETFSLTLAEGLVHRGHSILVIAFQPTADFIAYEKRDKLEVFRFLSIQLASAETQLSTYRQIKSIFETKKPDILHLQYAANSNLAYYFLLLKHISIAQVMTVHGVLNQTEQLLLEKILTRMKHVVFVSKALKQQLLSLLSHTFCATSVIYNALELTVKNPDTSFNSPWTFLCLGRMTEEKGYRFAIQAFSLVHKKYPDTRLILVGDGPELSHLNALVHQLSLQMSVLFKSGVSMDERVSVIEQVHVVLIPSYYESFGLVALEAGLLGRTVIAAQVGGLPEIVEEGVTGFLFTSGDVAGLADRMAYLIQNPKYITQIREQAPTVLRSRFNYLSMLKRYELVYEQSSAV